MADDTYIIIKLVHAYLVEADRQEREAIAEAIFRAIYTDLHYAIKFQVYDSEHDDVMSKTLEAIFKDLQKSDAKTDKRFLAWCKGIARHKVIDQRRKRRPTQEISTLQMKEIEASVRASMETNPPSTDIREELERLMNLLKSSKPECYEWLWAHFYDGIGIAELATLLKLEYNTMLRRIQRCLKRIRTYL